MAGAGAGAGAGGMMMAHQANAVGQGAAPPPPQAAASTGIHGPPIFIGADLADKNQSLSVKHVKNVAHLPLVAIDLHAPEPNLAYFPPKPEDTSTGIAPGLIGKMYPDIHFKTGDVPHKTLRKYLSQSKTYYNLNSDSICSGKDHTGSVAIKKPQRWLGFRRLSDAPDFYPGVSNETANSKSHAIDEEANVGVGAVVVNSTLDGSSPTGDDFDRVVYKIRLTESKKAISVLAEEATQMLFRQAQYHVAMRYKKSPEDEEILDFPCAVALPAWYFHDAAVEALMESCESGVVVFPRNICALVGSLIAPQQGEQASPLLKRVVEVRKVSYKEYEKQLAQDRDAEWEDEVTIIVIGTTDDGIEATAVQVSEENADNACALLGDYKVIANVAYQSKDPVSLLDRCITELEERIELLAPEVDGPAGILLCGSDELRKAWKPPKEWTKVPLFRIESIGVALGCAVLGGVSHGRSTRKRSVGNRKTKADFAIQVQNVAPCAVGVRMSYHGRDKKVDWSKVPVKTIFDFDRRIPAGPNVIDLNAAECAVHRAGGSEKLSDEELLKAIEANEGSKGIPKREEAALNLRVQIVQKWTRDGDWKPVGDVMKPLIKTVGEGEDSKEEACERISLELKLATTGMITQSFSGEL